MERLVGKISSGRIAPRELNQLKTSFMAIGPLKEYACTEEHLSRLLAELDPCAEMRDRIAHEIAPEPSTSVSKCGVIASGVLAELDELRMMTHSSKEYLASLQERLSQESGIPSLKISFNNVFGYYIEVRNTHKDKVLPTWVRKQTLVNAERYVTDELKEYESRILTAQDRILYIETQIYNELLSALTGYLSVIQRDANVLSELDVLLSFCNTAAEYGYVRPTLTQDDVIDIADGRHPVIERLLPVGQQYVPNSVLLNRTDQQIMVITGPNMAGKSALLRQVALIVLMAQIGSYVPASAATIGVVDKIFTRVGASDNISQGESTFMVEMNEAANILNNVTPRSLVLFDELGRGTSTYDGISLAWSIVEYLHENPKAQAKTLFATHYHELNDMEKLHARIKNYNVSVRELDGKVIFLRKLVPGGSEHSFGIHVAKLAGMPQAVVSRANEILAELESAHQQGMPAANERQSRVEKGFQYSIFQLDDPVLKDIRDQINSLDINNLTPIEALNKLSDIKKLLGI